MPTPSPAIKILGEPSLVLQSIKKARDFFAANYGKLTGVHTKRFQDGIDTRIDMDGRTVVIRSFEGAYQWFYYDGTGPSGVWAVEDTLANIGSVSAVLNGSGRIISRSAFSNTLKWAMDEVLPNASIHNVWHGEGYTCIAGAGPRYASYYRTDLYNTYPKFFQGNGNYSLGPVLAVAAARKGAWNLSINFDGTLTWWSGDVYYHCNPPVTATVSGRAVYGSWNFNKDCTRVVGVLTDWTGSGTNADFQGQIVEYEILEDPSLGDPYRFTLVTLQSVVPTYYYGSAMAADYNVLADGTEQLVVVFFRFVEKWRRSSDPYPGLPSAWDDLGWHGHLSVVGWNATNKPVIGSFSINNLGSGDYESKLAGMDLKKGIIILKHIDLSGSTNKYRWDIYSLSGSIIYKAPTPSGMQFHTAPDVEAYVRDSSLIDGYNLLDATINALPVGDHYVISRAYYAWLIATTNVNTFIDTETTLSCIPSVSRTAVAVYQQGTDGVDVFITGGGPALGYHQQMAVNSGLPVLPADTPRTSFNSTYQHETHYWHRPSGYAASATFLWPFPAWSD